MSIYFFIFLLSFIFFSIQVPINLELLRVLFRKLKKDGRVVVKIVGVEGSPLVMVVKMIRGEGWPTIGGEDDKRGKIMFGGW